MNETITVTDAVRAVPGHYLREPLRKRIGPWGVPFPHGTATPTTPEEKHYRSWYA